jgi:hypothetical protein
MAVFWVEAPNVSEVLAASIIRAMMEAASTSETLVNFYQIHGATTQKTAIFVLTAVRSSNPT